MNDAHDLELLLRSGVPLVQMETRQEQRALALLDRLQGPLGLPLYRWSVTEGLARVVGGLGMEGEHREPHEVLARIKEGAQAGLYALLDFHPYVDEPVHVRLLKDIALRHEATRQVLVFISHRIELPAELSAWTARFQLSLPGREERLRIVREVAREWKQAHPGRKVKAEAEALDALVDNLAGLTPAEVRRLARRAIFDDGAVTADDVPAVAEAKHRLLNRTGVLGYVFATERFSDIAGLERLKRWLELRREAFRRGEGPDLPRGILLLGVQGCGKSLAAKAVAGTWGVPLLSLDMGALYNKYHGETERNVREALATAEAMAPCVLWIDEVEKGVAHGGEDGGTSRRVLATLLTWMAERRAPVFLVATANDISALPPELVRKGRFDEIFFVDLPDAATRAAIFAIHLDKRGQAPALFNLEELAAATEGFSGAEIEQVVVAARYAGGERVRHQDLMEAIRQTRPLSRVMAEHIGRLREWGRTRAVPAG